MRKTGIRVLALVLTVLVVCMNLSVACAAETITPNVDIKFREPGYNLWHLQGHLKELYIPQNKWIIIKPYVTYKGDYGEHRLFTGNIKLEIYNLNGKKVYSKTLPILYSLIKSYYFPTNLAKGKYTMLCTYSGCKWKHCSPTTANGVLYIY